MAQQVLIMSTIGSSVRSSAVGWTMEDASIARSEVNFGHSRKHRDIGKILAVHPGSNYSYEAPLFALADDFKLLAPPSLVDKERNEYEWWFVREV